MLPQSFVERIKEQAYIDAVPFFKSIEQKPITSIRLHPEKKADLSHLELSKIPWSKNGYFLKERPIFTLDPQFHAGAYYVQDASSQFLEHVLNYIKKDLPSSPRILDLCAAPGGKSTHILSWLNHQGLLVSNEVIQSRVKILHENIVKWGYENVIVTNSDPKAFLQIEEYFDVIIIDAPCSGEGLFRKDTNAINEWSPNNCDLCANRQKRIVADALHSLKPGGFLIYSTCTFNPSENELNADFFSTELALKNVKIPNLDNGVTKVVSPNNNEGYIFLPNNVNGEGFYLTCFQKDGELSSFSFPKNKNKRNGKETTIPKHLYNYIKPDKELEIISFLDNYYILPLQFILDFNYLQNKAKIYAVGIELGNIKGKDFVPHHSLSQALHFNNESFRLLELNSQSALQFLKKEDFSIDNTEEPGWFLTTYNKTPLGFIKKVNNRVNNYYPNELKIRMKIT